MYIAYTLPVYVRAHYKKRRKGTIFFAYIKIFCKKSAKYLRISKKSSTFAPAFEKSRARMVVIAQLAEHRIVVPSVVGVLGKTL